MSTGPRSRSIFEMCPSIWVRSERSHIRPRLLMPVAANAAWVAVIESAPLPATAMFAPSCASDSAIARPKPPPPASTSAVFPLRPKSMGSFYLGFEGDADGRTFIRYREDYFDLPRHWFGVQRNCRSLRYASE